VKVLRIIPLLLLLTCSLAGQAFEYDRESIRPVRQLIDTLRAYEKQFTRLLELRAGIDARRKKLQKQHRILGREQYLRSQDRQRLDQGKLSKAAFDSAWLVNGRSRALDRAIANFKKRVALYNRELKEYNALARALLRFLNKRSPDQVRALVRQIRKLRQSLSEQIADGRYAKAAYMAENSALAKEFGYQSR
jgi:hypothetical protein